MFHTGSALMRKLIIPANENVGGATDKRTRMAAKHMPESSADTLNQHSFLQADVLEQQPTAAHPLSPTLPGVQHVQHPLASRAHALLSVT